MIYSTVSFLRKHDSLLDLSSRVMVGSCGPSRRLMKTPSQPEISL